MCRPPDTAPADDLRSFQIHQHEHDASESTINGAVAAQHFLYGGTLKRQALTRSLVATRRQLITSDERGITFRFKDYRRDGPEQQQIMKLPTDAFIRRFLAHVLPKGFHHIRHYGIHPRRRHSDCSQHGLLACNLNDLRKLVQTLTKRGITIEFVRESLSFTGEVAALADPMLSVIGAFTEFERALIRERQREGIAIAKQRISRVQKIAFGCQNLRTDTVRCWWRAAVDHQHSIDRLAAQKIC